MANKLDKIISLLTLLWWRTETSGSCGETPHGECEKSDYEGYEETPYTKDMFLSYSVLKVTSHRH